MIIPVAQSRARSPKEPYRHQDLEWKAARFASSIKSGDVCVRTNVSARLTPVLRTPLPLWVALDFHHFHSCSQQCTPLHLKSLKRSEAPKTPSAANSAWLWWSGEEKERENSAASHSWPVKRPLSVARQELSNLQSSSKVKTRVCCVSFRDFAKHRSTDTTLISCTVICNLGRRMLTEADYSPS